MQKEKEGLQNPHHEAFRCTSHRLSHAIIHTQIFYKDGSTNFCFASFFLPLVSLSVIKVTFKIEMQSKKIQSWSPWPTNPPFWGQPWAASVGRPPGRAHALSPTTPGCAFQPLCWSPPHTGESLVSAALQQSSYQSPSTGNHQGLPGRPPCLHLFDS